MLYLLWHEDSTLYGVYDNRDRLLDTIQRHSERSTFQVEVPTLNRLRSLADFRITINTPEDLEKIP